MAVAQFVVDLPGDYGRMPGVMLCHGRYQTAHAAAVAFAALTIVMAAAESAAHAVCVHREIFRVRLNHPCGRCGRGGAENDPDAVSGQHADGAIHPFEMILALAGFEFMPGKFSQPHRVDSHLAHQLRVRFPAAFRPVFGIVVYAEK